MAVIGCLRSKLIPETAGLRDDRFPFSSSTYIALYVFYGLVLSQELLIKNSCVLFLCKLPSDLPISLPVFKDNFPRMSCIDSSESMDMFLYAVFKVRKFVLAPTCFPIPSPA